MYKQASSKKSYKVKFNLVSQYITITIQTIQKIYNNIENAIHIIKTNAIKFENIYIIKYVQIGLRHKMSINMYSQTKHIIHLP